VAPSVLGHSLPPYSTIVICSSSNLTPIVGTWPQFLFRLRDIFVYYLPALLPLIVYPGELDTITVKINYYTLYPRQKPYIHATRQSKWIFNFYTALKYTQLCSPDAEDTLRTIVSLVLGAYDALCLLLYVTVRLIWPRAKHFFIIIKYPE
jgi:hypothetical protein